MSVSHIYLGLSGWSTSFCSNLIFYRIGWVSFGWMHGIADTKVGWILSEYSCAFGAESNKSHHLPAKHRHISQLSSSRTGISINSESNIGLYPGWGLCWCICCENEVRCRSISTPFRPMRLIDCFMKNMVSRRFVLRKVHFLPFFNIGFYMLQNNWEDADEYFYSFHGTSIYQKDNHLHCTVNMCYVAISLCALISFLYYFQLV